MRKPCSFYVRTKYKMNQIEDRLGRVFTPVSLIQEIYTHLSPYLRPNLKVYEPGVGDHRFFNHYPLSCTYEGCEIEPMTKIEPTTNIEPMAKNLSVFEGDFFDQPLGDYDLILGNPPFRIETTGPSSSPIPHKPKQKTIWPEMVTRCFKHLKPDGLFAMVLPCIWLKPDKAGIYDLFTQHRILVLKCFSCVESNKLFGYKGQTPVCYVVVQKSPPHPNFQIWDKGFIPFTLYPGHCIPTRRAGLLQYSRSLFQTPWSRSRSPPQPKPNWSLPLQMELCIPTKTMNPMVYPMSRASIMYPRWCFCTRANPFRSWTSKASTG